ncbi:hypothetical protein ACLQ2Q_20495 [Microbacterium sp. DT81.1]|uniref:hypothetical protein n=1 Tax=Microbacterium sp. DT81.1 TaxID=3393413 RepID=UPI003CF18660
MNRPRYTELPEGVTVYENPFVYLAENPDREAANGVTGDLGGWDVADGFRLAETQLPGTPESEWRISIIAGEIYAVLRRLPLERGYTFDGPVWLIARIPERLREGSAWGLVPPDPVVNLMTDVERLRSEPDSLLTAVRTIREQLPQLAGA